MTQIPINPYDNDRLKTRKVNAMLDDLGVLPADHRLRPNFLRGQHIATYLIDKALANLPLVHKCAGKNLRQLATISNEKFATAYVEFASGQFVTIGEAGFGGGTYMLNGQPAALGDIIDLNHADTAFDPVTDVDAEGVHPHALQGGGTQNVNFFLKDPLLSQVLGGYTCVLLADYQTEVGVAGGTGIFLGAGDDPDFLLAPGVNILWDANNITPTPPFQPPADEIYVYDATPDQNSDRHYHLIGANGLHKIAITFTATQIAFSFDGGAAFTFAAPGTDPALNYVVFSIGGQLDCHLKSFAFYEPVDDADLPALSAL